MVNFLSELPILKAALLLLFQNQPTLRPIVPLVIVTSFLGTIEIVVIGKFLVVLLPLSSVVE